MSRGSRRTTTRRSSKHTPRSCTNVDETGKIRIGLLGGAANAGMLVFGVVMALLGAVLPALSARIGFDLAQAGQLFLVMNLCMLVCSLGLGPAMDRIGMKAPMTLGPLAVGGALL